MGSVLIDCGYVIRGLEYIASPFDCVAHLRLAATVPWLRGHPPKDIGAALEKRTSDLRREHRVGGNDQTRYVVRVDDIFISDNRHRRFELPLPQLAQP